jgi:hypothetical protein
VWYPPAHLSQGGRKVVERETTSLAVGAPLNPEVSHSVFTEPDHGCVAPTGVDTRGFLDAASAVARSHFSSGAGRFLSHVPYKLIICLVPRPVVWGGAGVAGGAYLYANEVSACISRAPHNNR